jgi:hypothetical protein
MAELLNAEILLCSQSMHLSGNDAKQVEIQKKAGAI